MIYDYAKKKIYKYTHLTYWLRITDSGSNNMRLLIAVFPEICIKIKNKYSSIIITITIVTPHT